MSYLGDAIVAAHPDRAEIWEISAPNPGPDHVVVRATYSGVSTGTDRWVMQGKFDWSELQFPLVSGYQKVGVVVEAGSNAEHLLGQQVLALVSIDFELATAAWGGHSKYSTHPVSEVYPLRGQATPASALCVSVQVGYNAASRIDERAARRVAVIGDGIIGASAAISALHLGFEVLQLGRHERRLAATARAGVQGIIDSSENDALQAFRPDAVVDTIQSATTAAAVAKSLPRETGQVVYAGHSPGLPQAWASMTELQQLGLTAHFISGWNRARMEHVLDLIERGELPVATLGIEVHSRVGSLAAIQALLHPSSPPLAAVLSWEG